ncbi:MAG: protein translocase subunit SecF [Actinobacteria bacterium]|nr:protein translocase subunit SecF [Actinomycetota bacterium]
MYKIIQNRKTWLSISGLLVAASIILLIAFGLNFGIDFTGGSLLEVRFLSEKPTAEEIKNALSDLDLGSLTVQPAGEDGMLLRFQDISEEKHQEVLTTLKGLMSQITDNNISNSKLEELRFDSVGPSIGEELKRKSVYAMFFVLIAIVLYIAWAFRKVSKPIVSWKYGVVAIITLFHDVIITVGVFVILGKFFGIEVNTPFVVAILTVLGYSVNDTIVVFDRIRENLPRSEEDFEGTINTSVNQTITRSINTSITTLAVLLSIVFFGGQTIQSFALALSVGVFIGTYSSIFLASPLLVVWEKFRS